MSESKVGERVDGSKPSNPMIFEECGLGSHVLKAWEKEEKKMDKLGSDHIFDQTPPDTSNSWDREIGKAMYGSKPGIKAQLDAANVKVYEDLTMKGLDEKEADLKKSEYYTPLMERWKDVIEYEDEYEVSNLGNVRRKSCNLKQFPNIDGYKILSLSKNGKTKTQFVHRLMLKAFVPNPENKEQVNHMDCNKQNNNLENLEWVTPEENMKHAVENDRQRNQNGENNNMSKLTEKDVLSIRKLLEDGITTYKIHKEYYPHLHQQTIYAIKQRRLWNNV